MSQVRIMLPVDGPALAVKPDGGLGAVAAGRGVGVAVGVVMNTT